MPTLKWSLFCIDSLSKYLLNLHEALLQASTINQWGKKAHEAHVPGVGSDNKQITD